MSSSRTYKRLGRTGRRVGLALTIAALGVAVTGCGAVSSGTDNAADSGTAAKADPTKKVRVAVFMTSTANTYGQAVVKGIKEQAAEMGDVEVSTFDGKFDGRTQAAQIQDANATGKFDAYVVLVVDGTTVIQPIKKAIANGVKVVAGQAPIGADPLQGTPQVDGVLATIWHEQPKDGTALGETIIEACKAEHAEAETCKAAFVYGNFAVATEQASIQALKKTLAASKGPKVELVASGQGDFLRPNGRKAAQDILQAHPDVNVIATSGDQMTVGVQDAVKGVGKLGKVSLIGTGASKQGVEAVEAGDWFATLLYLPYTEGRLDAELVVKAVRGQELPTDETDINVRDSSPIGPSFDQQTEKSFKAQWHT